MSRDDDLAEVLADWRMRRESGESIDPEAVIAAHPELAEDLRSHFAAVQLLDFAVLERMDAERTRDAPDREGARIGPYEVLGLIGKGGMGRVYLADQQEPIQRRVALKVLDGRVDNPKRRARFEVEREALALMDSPYIAPVYDAGVAADGTPYVAMAYVEGAPVTEYCASEGLGLAQRLELFAKVCEGVHHAHQKGVIHRDIKPTNVLVVGTIGQATPRVIDFGLAKAFDTTLGVESQLTIDDQILGTPAYMSPEQAKGQQDVDVRSDVYALGVLLYEMLTGDVPWGRESFTRRNLAASLQRILEQEPPKPSTHASTIQRRRTQDEQREPTPFTDRALKGDLDWIVMKALAKERDRRYASAQDLAEDVRRHLRNEPVEAGPPTVGYRLGKFVRRHKAGVIGGAAAILALGAGLVVSLWLYQDAEFARQDAIASARGEAQARIVAERSLEEKDHAARRAQAVSDLLLDLFRLARPGYRGADARLLDVLEAAERRLAAREDEHPDTAATLHHALGTTWLQLGSPAKATPHLERAAAARGSLLGPRHDDTLDSRLALLDARERGGNYDALLDDVRTLRAFSEIAAVPALVLRLDEIEARHATSEEHGEQAVKLWTAIVERRMTIDADSRGLLVARLALAKALHAVRRFEAWSALAHELAGRVTELLPPDDPVACQAHMEHARALLFDGKAARAADVSRALLPRIQGAAGARHADALAALTLHAEALEANGDVAKAAVARDRLASLQAGREDIARRSETPAGDLARVLAGWKYLNVEPPAWLPIPAASRLVAAWHARLEVGDKAGGREASAEMVATLERLVARQPNRLHKRALAEWLVFSVAQSGLSPEAGARQCRRAVELMVELHAAYPDDLDIARELATARHELAVALRQIGRHGDQVRELRRVIDQLRGITDASPDDVRAWRWLAVATGSLARHLVVGLTAVSEKADEALRLAKESGEAADRIQRVHDYRHEAAKLAVQALMYQVTIRGRAGPTRAVDDAHREMLRRAREYYERIKRVVAGSEAEQERDVGEGDLADALAMYAEAGLLTSSYFTRARGHLEYAQGVAEKAVAALDGAASRLQRNLAWRTTIAMKLRLHLVDIHFSRGAFDAGAEQASRLRVTARLLHKRRGDAEAARWLAQALRRSAIIALQRRRYDQAREFAVEALQMIRAELRAAGDADWVDSSVGDLQTVLIRVWIESGEPKRALPVSKEVIAARQAGLSYLEERGTGERSDAYTAQALMLGMAYSDRGIALSHLGRYEEALQDFEKQYALQRRVLEVRPGSGPARQNVGVALWRLDEVTTTLGRLDEACKHQRRLIELRKEAAEENWVRHGESLVRAYRNLAGTCLDRAARGEAQAALHGAWSAWGKTFAKIEDEDGQRWNRSAKAAADLARLSLMLGHAEAPPHVARAMHAAQRAIDLTRGEASDEQHRRLATLTALHAAVLRARNDEEPTSAWDHLARAYVLRRAGKHAEAVGHFHHGLKTRDQDSSYRYFHLMAAAGSAAMTGASDRSSPEARQALAWLREQQEAWEATYRATIAAEVRDEKVRAARLQAQRHVRARLLRANADFTALREHVEFAKILGTKGADR